MLKSSGILCAFFALFFLSSFTNENTSDFIGTYGVSDADPSLIKLTLRSDHTFYYQDFSVSDQKIMVTGNWTLKGRKVMLDDNGSNEKFHNVWTISDDGQVAKSRKGLTFYSLCRLDG